MSRLIVKGLPAYVDEKRLREHFGSKGVVTDAKVIRKKDGKSRCFGFVGFQEESSARDAVDFFHRTYMDTSRIHVEIAKPKGSSDIKRPWSQHSKGSSRHEEKHPEMYVKKIENDEDDDDDKDEVTKTTPSESKSAERKLKLQEFLKLSKVSSSKQERQSWADNPDLINVDSDKNMKQQDEKEEEEEEDDLAFLKSKTTDNFSDDEDERKSTTIRNTLADTGRLFLRNLYYQCEEEKNRESFSKYCKLTEVHVPVDRAGRRTGIAFVSYLFPEDAVRNCFELLEFEVYICLENCQSNSYHHQQQHTRIHTLERSNPLPTSTTRTQVRALTAMDAQIFRGRILHVLPAKQRKVDDNEEDDEEKDQDKKKVKKLSWKKQKEKKRKEEADNEASWNTLFLRADTVVDRLAKHMKLKKSDILDRESNASMAVQMALAETHILETTKQQLENAGVNLDALNQSARRNGVSKSERNDRVLLVKNLPVETKAAELTRLFAPFGEIGRFVFPEPNVIALIEFLDSSSARRAFRGLAYKRFKHVPLYLEWAPKDVFHNLVATSKEMAAASVSATVTGNTNTSSTTTTTTSSNSIEPSAVRSSSVGARLRSESIRYLSNLTIESLFDITRKQSNPFPRNTHSKCTPHRNILTTHQYSKHNQVPTLFVKNLNFATTTKRLRKAFQRQCKGVRSASVATRQSKRNKKSKESAVLSMGYGFVEFESSEDAAAALKSAQGMVIDGHKIELRLSRKQSADKVVAAEKLARKSKKRSADPRGNENGDKIMVKNLAFEATRQEVRELFGSFGQLRSVRIPRKFDGGHRGFGFVEYISKQDAKNAFKQLTSTHFYGRRLVVEWAAASASISDLRAKSKRELSTLKQTPTMRPSESTFGRGQKF